MPGALAGPYRKKKSVSKLEQVNSWSLHPKQLLHYTNIFRSISWKLQGRKKWISDRVRYYSAWVEHEEKGMSANSACNSSWGK